VLGLLADLIDKSLVVADETSGSMRHRLLETIREYAGEKLAVAGEADVVRTRHRDWCLGLAEQALPALVGPDQKRWLDRVEDEHDNLRAALAWCASQSGESPALLRLAALLGRFWRLRGYNGEAIGWLGTALARSAATPSVGRARALYELGHFEWSAGSAERAHPLLTESVAQARMVGERELLAEALRNLSYVTISVGDQAQARRLLEEALAVSREAGYKREIAYALFDLAGVIGHEGRLEVIEPLLVESLAVARESGDATTVCEALTGLGWVHQRRGELARARNALDECLALARRSDIATVTGIALLLLGDLAAIEKDLETAIDLYRQVLRGVLDVHGGLAAYVLYRYATVSSALGEHRRAARLFGATATVPPTESTFLMFDRAAGAEENVAAVRMALGERGFAAAWAEGRAMTLEEAVADALGGGRDAAPT
jgi:tetratricopeptide (TPR) repeat protein